MNVPVEIVTDSAPRCARTYVASRTPKTRLTKPSLPATVSEVPNNVERKDYELHSMSSGEEPGTFLKCLTSMMEATTGNKVELGADFRSDLYARRLERIISEDTKKVISRFPEYR